MNIKLRKLNYHFKAAEDDVGGGGESTETSSENDSTGNQSETQSVWPDTWREAYAGEDEKKLSRVSKYASPTAAFDALIAAQNKISSGEYKQITPFPESGTDEEKNAWRASNGIPEAPDKYDLNFESGLVIGEDDKPIIDDFLNSAHSKNLPPDAVKSTIEWYYQNQEKMAEERAAADKELQNSTEDALRAEWGNEYRANLNRIHGLLDMAPEGVKDKILDARFIDGTPLGSDPDALKFLIDLALQVNPATTLVPGAGDNINGAIADELANLEKMMGNKTSDYWKGPHAEKNQQRYRDLVKAQERMN